MLTPTDVRAAIRDVPDDLKALVDDLGIVFSVGIDPRRGKAPQAVTISRVGLDPIYIYASNGDFEWGDFVPVDVKPSGVIDFVKGAVNAFTRLLASR